MHDDLDHHREAAARAKERWDNARPWLSAATALIVVAIIVVGVCVHRDIHAPPPNPV